MNPLWKNQILAIVRLEMKKTFFARRGLWIYFLALAPLLMFAGHAIDEMGHRNARREMARESVRPLTRGDFSAVHEGMTRDEVTTRLGPAPEIRSWDNGNERLRYSNADADLTVILEQNKVTGLRIQDGCNLADDSLIFAGVFQFFYLRLVVFFGCLGIFMNLFRGELLDRTLHFYLLAPVRREVLVAGKYCAGLLAAGVIFTTSTALQLVAMGWHLNSNDVSRYLYHEHGFAHVFAYLGVTLLACAGYGSVFLAAGLLYRNPIIPAAAILLWEWANPFLPTLLRKFSVIYYLKSLCPVSVPMDPGAPAILAMFVTNAEPIAAPLAILGLLAVAGLILSAAAVQARRLQINYTSE